MLTGMCLPEPTHSVRRNVKRYTDFRTHFGIVEKVKHTPSIWPIWQAHGKTWQWGAEMNTPTCAAPEMSSWLLSCRCALVHSACLFPACTRIALFFCNDKVTRRNCVCALCHFTFLLVCLWVESRGVRWLRLVVLFPGTACLPAQGLQPRAPCAPREPINTVAGLWDVCQCDRWGRAFLSS